MSNNIVILVNFIFLFLTLIALTVCLIDHFIWQKHPQKYPKNDRIVQLSYDFLPALLIIVFLRTYVLEPFTIPSESMYPQLTNGDVIVVSKSSYGIKFPMTNINIIKTGEPKRGDVAVFQFPLDTNTNFIKRVVGLPGDTIIWKGDDMFINGEKVHRERAIFTSEIDFQGVRYSWETLGDVNYKIRRLTNDDSSEFDRTSAFVQYRTDQLMQAKGVKPEQYKGYLELHIPKGYYFMMGDNRDQSQDSRTWGLVDQNYLVGRAKFIAVHFNPKVPIWKPWEKISFARSGFIK